MTYQVCPVVGPKVKQRPTLWEISKEAIQMYLEVIAENC